MQSRGEKDPATLPCQLISWEAFYQLSRQLAHSVRAAGFQPDIIVAIARGGYMPARILSDHLNVFDLASIKIEHYRGARRESIANIRYPLQADISGRRVLLVDDVSDTGDTFAAAMRHLREHGKAAALRTAVLHHKRVSRYMPDFFAEEVIEWCWITYPWALIEDLSGFLSHIEPRPASVEAFDAALCKRHGLRVERELLSEVLALNA